MLETVVSVEEAAARLSELVERVQTRQEAAVITRSGQPVARIVPMPRVEGSEDLIAFLHRWRSQYPESDDQFSGAIDESRQIVQPAQNPWD